MAISKNIEYKGLTVNGCYIRVASFSGNKEAMSFVVEYKNSDNILKVDSFSCSYDIDGANPIAQAYAHMKTLEAFAGHIDC